MLDAHARAENLPGTMLWTPRYRIEPATREHVLAMGSKLRAEDRAEIAGLGGNVRKELWRGFRNSIWCRVATVDGELAAIWGLCVAGRPGVGPLSGKAVPWLLTTDAIERIPVAFVRHARREVAAMRQLYPALENHVAADYRRAVKFLRLMGFTVDPPEPVGVDGALFRRFHLSRSTVERRAHQTPVCRPGVAHAPFIVYTAGRSRTAWLSAFLSYDKTTCHNEAAMRFRRMADVAAFFAAGRTGTAETAAAPAWRLINHYVPGIRSVVVRRPIEDIVASFARSEVAHIAAIDEDRLRRVIAYEDRCLQQISAQPGTLTVDFDALGQAETCARVFEHCLPYRFDRGWWEFLRAQNIQSSVADLFAYYRDNHDAVERFKREAKRDMITLVRAGHTLRT